MMRRLAYLLPLALFFFSCQHEAGEEAPSGPYIEIRLSTGDPEKATKADDEGANIYTQDGIDEIYHENWISKIDLFFYPGEKTEENASYHYRVEYASGKEKIKNDLLRLSFNSGEIEQFFFPGETEKCTVFAVVNWPGDLIAEEAGLSKTSLPELYAKPLTTNFVDRDKRLDPTTNHAQPNFVMTGLATMALRGRNQVLSAVGNIALERLACKMTVGVKVASSVSMGNDVWEPMLGGMEVYLVDGVKRTTLGGRLETPSGEDYFSYRYDPSVFFRLRPGTDDQYDPVAPQSGDFYNTYPLYMYPQKWEYGSTNAPTKEPYLKLVLPWRRTVGGTTQKSYYYKVLIPNDYREEYLKQFVRNNWYHVDIYVSILGTETDDDKAPLTATGLQIFYWQDKNVVVKNARIGNARYLSADRDTSYVYNENSATMPYVSSHPVRITDIRVGRPYDGTVTSGDAMGGTITVAGEDDIFPKGTRYLNFDEAHRKAVYKRFHGEEKDWFTDTGEAIVIHHDLVNDYKDKDYFDYSPYTIRYTLVHDDKPDDANFKRVQTVIQYPGIYLTYTPNDAPKKAESPYGYVWVDNAQLTKKQFEQNNPDWKTDMDYRNENIWRVVHYSSGGTDMYRITTTVLPQGSEFVLGDPRVNESDIPRTFRPAKSVHPDNKGKLVLDEGERGLLHYYPTDPESRTVNMIAPSFQISTKFSGSEYDGVTLQQARWRCAAFQENGFPAGRWRLPTKGEIKFAAQLSANGVFEWQFGGNYWSANGPVHVNKDTGEVRDAKESELVDKSRALLRCVYDSWYWGDERFINPETKKPDTYVWADSPRWGGDE
ncbi:MAG: hypothetical protein IJQ96_09475 [Bacteroidales bacterium]|nr:hypothetical protein [Bacteroidales bacterium]